MEKMKTIPLFVESDNGHDTLNIPNNPQDIQQAVEKQLKEKKWVVTENKDGSSEILTEEDIQEEDEEELDDADKELMKEAGDWKGAFKSDKGKPIATATQSIKKTAREEWESKFENVKSAMSMNKAKGG